MDMGEEIAALVAVRQDLEDAAVAVVAASPEVPAEVLRLCGTDELPAALSTLEACERPGEEVALDEEESAARWVARAWKLADRQVLADELAPAVALSVLTLAGAVARLRLVLVRLDRLIGEGDGPEAPGRPGPVG